MPTFLLVIGQMAKKLRPQFARKDKDYVEINKNRMNFNK